MHCKIVYAKNTVFTEGYYKDLAEKIPEVMMNWMEKFYPTKYFMDKYHISYRALRCNSDLKERYLEDFGEFELSMNQISMVNASRY